MLAALAALCAAVLGAVAYWKTRPQTLASLLERLPPNAGIILHVDFAALRQAGVLSVLSGNEMMREPEYRAFVDQTGFEYLRDLDSAVAAFTPNSKYFLLRGRFNWKLLRTYVETQGGTCHNAVCAIEGSTPERQISFFPVERNLMALAVSPGRGAATDLKQRHAVVAAGLPQHPIWAIVSPAAIRPETALPGGTRAFARALQSADRVVFAFGPDAYGMNLFMDVTCRSSERAAALAAQLREVTAALGDLIRKEGQAPNPRDLSGVLTAGVFEQRGVRVTGRWPVPRAFLETLAGGAL